MFDVKRLTMHFLSVRTGLAHSVASIAPPKEIEDIVQEAYVRLCQAGKKSSIRDPKSYLFRTVRNLAFDHVKRAESRLTESLEDAGDWQTEPLDNHTFEQIAADEEFARFCEAVRQLPLQCQRAFVLRKVYGYSQREIARELNLSESTVEKHIMEGIKRCTYFMERFAEAPLHGREKSRSTRNAGDWLPTPKESAR